MKITFGETGVPKAGAAIAGVLEEGRFTPSAEELDRLSDGALRRAVAASRFTGKKDEILAVLAPAHLPLGRVLLVGLGKPASIDALQFQNLGGNLTAHLNSAGEKEAAFLLDPIDGVTLSAEEAAANLAYGAALRSYRFDRYRTKEKPESKPTLERFAVHLDKPAGAKKRFQTLEKIAESIAFARDLVSEPANVIYPESLAAEAKKLEDLGVEVEILDEKKLAKLGMGALLGVAQGSARPPRLVILHYQGRGTKDEAPVAFIGKGVTFDSGGISIKPSGGMEDMKWDMAGSAVVIGLIRALAARKAKVNAVGIVGLVENMPSGTAQRPGDIVKSMSGQTIEVLNTDAEGRLVLADALWYCQDRFKPRLMIDLATLTGAIVVALGSENAGLFSNNDELAERIAAAGKSVGETVWRLPLADAYDRMLDSDAADMRNVTNDRGAGSITAAQFLQRFVNEVPWAHIDIAGVTWTKKDAPTVPKGATAFGVRLLDRLVADHYEG